MLRIWWYSIFAEALHIPPLVFYGIWWMTVKRYSYGYKIQSTLSICRSCHQMLSWKWHWPIWLCPCHCTKLIATSCFTERGQRPHNSMKWNSSDKRTRLLASKCPKSIEFLKITIFAGDSCSFWYHQLRNGRALYGCSDENQKGAIAVQSLWQQCPSASQWNMVEQRQYPSGSQPMMWTCNEQLL